MTLQTINRGLTVPAIGAETSVTGFSPKVLDAAGEKFGAIIQVPKTGTIAKVGFLVGSVTSSQTLKISLETISASDPTGSAYGGMVAGTQASPAANTFYVIALGTGATATAGDQIAVVIEFDSTVGDLEIDSMASSFAGFPYVDLFTAAWVRDDWIPVVALEYSDGSYENIGTFPADVLTSSSYANDSTPDERALRFSLPFPCRITGFWAYIDVNDTFDVVLYEGTTAKTTQSFGSHWGSTGYEIYKGYFATPFVITKDTEYFLSIKPTTATGANIRMQEFTVQAAAIMDSFSGGQNIYLGTRTDAGAWTTTTTRRPRMGMIIDQADDGVGTGVSGIDIHNSLITAPYRAVSY